MTISKIKLLEMVSIEILHERRVKDIMLFPHSVNINEDLEIGRASCRERV